MQRITYAEDYFPADLKYIEIKFQSFADTNSGHAKNIYHEFF